MAKTIIRPIIKIHNVETNDVIDREMTDDEFAQYQADQVAEAITQAEADANAAAKTAILNRIGLTADELQTILG